MGDMDSINRHKGYIIGSTLNLAHLTIVIIIKDYMTCSFPFEGLVDLIKQGSQIKDLHLAFKEEAADQDIIISQGKEAATQDIIISQGKEAVDLEKKVASQGTRLKIN